MKRTTWGVLVMFTSFLIETIIAVGSLIFNLPGGGSRWIIYAHLLPSLLEITGFILIVLGSNQMGNVHRRLVRLALIGLGLTIAVYLLFSHPPMFIRIRQGSPALVMIEQIAMTLTTLLLGTIPFLSIYGICQSRLRIVLWLALGLMVLVSFGDWWPITGMELRAIEAAGKLIFGERFGGDNHSMALRIFMIIGDIRAALYMLVYGVMTARLFLMDRSGMNMAGSQGLTA
jgi:hypothetical protein